jgi:hypothetical protein
MPETSWLQGTSPAFRLMIATSWLAPASWQDKQEEAIREAIGADPDWKEYVRLVDRHRTPALSWAALKRVPELKIPQPAKQELQKRSDACRMQAIRHSLQLAEVLKAFNRAGIPAMPFKGPILSHDLYGDIGLRQSKDLDLAVASTDLRWAQACLEDLGWRMDSDYLSLSPRQWESFLRHDHHLGFVHPRGDYALELHWRSRILERQDQITSRWARSIPSIWHGCTHQSLNPIDWVLDLSSHGGEHAWFRAKWLGDLARIHAEGSVDWEAVLGEAQRSGQERALLACLRLLKDVYGLPLPGLPGNPWKDLPSFLIDRPLHALKTPEEPTVPGVPATLPERFRVSRYNRLLLPQKTWRESLAELVYHRQDFKTLRLPDSLFWAYAPLRPILWLWRRVLRRRPANR